MVINFDRDIDDRFINPLAVQLEALLLPLYRKLKHERGDKAIEEFREWLTTSMPCEIKIEFNASTNYSYIFEIEVDEADYTMFLLKYADLLTNIDEDY